MSGLLDGLMEQLGGERLGQLAGVLGVDEDKAQSAISAALPALLGGLANNAQKPNGAAALTAALGDHDGSVLDDPSDILAGGGSGAGILGHVLGAKQPEVAQHIAGSSGLDLGAITKLLPMLAPMVMGYLGRKQRSDGLDSGGLANMLGGERKAIEGASPGLGGLSKILDRDGDGDMMDDIKDMAGGLLGGASGGGGGAKGGLGGLFGKLFGRK
jgi:hypothetical protein